MKRRWQSLGELPTLLRDALALAWAADRRSLLVSGILQISGGLVTALQVFIVTHVVSVLLQSQRGRPVSDAIPGVIALAAVISLSGISTAVVTQKQRLLAELTERRTRGRILDVAGAVDLWSYETSDFFDRLQRVRTSALTRPYFLTLGLIGLIGGLAGTVSLAVAVVVIQPLLLPLIVLSGLPPWFMARRASRREFNFVVEQTPVKRMRDYLDVTMTGRTEAKELRAFGLVPTLRRRYDGVYDGWVDALRRHVRRKQQLGVVGSTASGVLMAATFALLMWLVSDHHVSLSQVAGAVVGIRLLSSQLSALFAGAQQIFESNLFLADLNEFLSTDISPRARSRGRPASAAPGALPSPSASSLLAPLRAAPHGFSSLDVEELSFSYPASSELVLDGVSLSLHRGQVVALVGENGSGKTTLAKLLAGLYEPDAGVIRWDGVDVAHYDPASMRESIAVIFQDFVHYHLTARENIGMGKPSGIDDVDAIAEAAEEAGARGLIEELPLGFETLLSKEFEGGRDLSLGQWQRVALARAFYRDAPFVILDEPSASLDPRAEADLFSKVHSLLGGRTVLLISHRFSSVRHADQIYVMSGGRIVEAGSHAELMRVDGLYADLFTLQAAAYIDPVEAD